jgi:hypothetical protein
MEPCSMSFKRGFDCSICTQKRLILGPFLTSILVAFEFPQDSRVQWQYTEILEGKLRRCYSDEEFDRRLANRKLRYMYTFVAIGSLDLERQVYSYRVRTYSKRLPSG